MKVYSFNYVRIPAAMENNNKRKSEARKKLTDYYIKNLLANKLKISSKDVTQEMIVEKRNQLKKFRSKKVLKKSAGKER